MKIRRIFALAMVLLLLLSLTACGGSASKDAIMENAAEAPAEMETSASGNSLTSDSTSTNAAAENRKLIKTVQIEAETEDLDAILSDVDAKIMELGGYVEKREVYNGSAYSQRRYRRADMTIRIPADKVDGFVDHVEGVSNIVSANESVDDVTLKYVDTESRRIALETEQARLLDLLAKAQTMKDILTIEERLTEVRYQLESVTSQLRKMDNLVSYATVHLHITEVQEYTPVVEEEETVWQRISGGFMDSVESITDGAVEIMIWVLANSPYLVIWGAVITGVVFAARKHRKSKRPKEVKAEPPKEENKE